MIKLPNKSSRLLTVAMADLAKAERSRKYIIEMMNWHHPIKFGENKGKCAVCLAGAVMAYSLKADHGQTTNPISFEESNKLLALNYFRQGQVSRGLTMMGVECETSWPLDPEIRVTDYEKDSKLFKLDMKRVIRSLKEMGQ